MPTDPIQFDYWHRRETTLQLKEPYAYAEMRGAIWLRPYGSKLTKEAIMQVRIKPHTWNSLGLDDPERYDLALCSFYLGRNVEETRDLLNRPMSDAEVQYVYETAVLSGLNSNLDSIVQTK